MLLEICANSYESAINAQIAGAHRIELCSEISIGGISPSYGLITIVMQKIKIPVYVLIRPRSGNFTYSNEEFNIMKKNIVLCKDLGCAGIVSGVLHKNNTIDVKRTRELIELARPLSFTFHRAFDEVLKPKESLLELIELGVDRILTSGQQHIAEDGIELLIKLQKIAQDNLIIMPGGGINYQNSMLFKKVRFKEIHASASKVIVRNTHSYFGKTPQTISDIETIKKILDTIN